MISKTIGQYKILEKLGSGGMGEVWLASDTHLKRNVALKFLPSEVTSEEEKSRFFREARAASALDHPNICTIYEAGETDDDRTYIAMAFCDGETVKEKISRGPLELGEALDIAIQTGEGLAKAHKEGIVHRDIKPANAILTKEGTVKIVDFGLAKLTGVTQLTKTGTSMGTATYMSPEQIRGEGVDHGTDIWALGVMLYEMVTGQLPFQGENDTAVIYSVLNEDPGILSAIRQDIPRALEEVVGKALVKDPANRYQHVQEMVDEIRNLPSGETGQPEWEKSIVVLPFENMSPDPDQEYFSDGLTEEIITELSKIHSLRVISRNSAMMLKGTRKATKTIGRELNVQYVLEGSVRRVGNDLRITAQLIDASTDAHIWVEKYDGTLDDVFSIQETVARSIVEALDLVISPEESKRFLDRPIDNFHAYQCYLRARQDILLWTAEAMERATRHLEKGLEIVGENAAILYGLALVEVESVQAGLKTPQEADKSLQKAEEYATKILELEPDSPHGHCILGILNHWRSEYFDAVAHYKKVLEQDPVNPDVLWWLGIIYWATDNIEAAEPLAERLLETDPLSPRSHDLMGIILWGAGRLEAAAEATGRAHELEPENHQYRLHHVLLLLADDRTDEAKVLTEAVRSQSPENVDQWHLSLLASALRDDREEVNGLIESASYPESDLDENSCWQVAVAYHLIGEIEKTLDWLERAIDRGYVSAITLEAFFGNLRGEARFDDIMEKSKRARERFTI